MAKYTSYEELREGMIKNWAENTKAENYKAGLMQVAPPGMVPKEVRVKNYEKNTTEAEGETLVDNWVSSLFEPEKK